ncbi:LOW QUALITY PROTEIN: uncharacterized protein LOC113385573 [Ctenocephalides felis]|uniref:LOW QUALITY PROTEIN: uncharacterized protein LOC113385573 n=1 Tax=Ctenocephalides felis TaxID=7515 RepID=UPI000E6E3083|nr:LOW QUALITY PROTEIN: uncharacterized protein LOC113385573 [Ctenocephalides felis]
MAKNIVIIGAGAAGISAAVKLNKNGLRNVIILEASDRIGGRIHTTLFGNNTVDLGAQWCHGEEGNIVHDIVKDMNLLSSSEMFLNNEILISDGTTVSKDISKKLEEIYLKIAINEDDIIDPDLSVGQYVTNKYYNILKETEYQLIDTVLAEQYLEWCHKCVNSVDASDNWFESSAKGSLEYFECPGHPLLNWKGAGYIRFLEVLMEKYPDKEKDLNLDIRFQKEVTSIEWDQPTTKKPVTIKCKDNSSYDADHVIVTVPLGVLKNNTRLFQPALPEYKLKCIDNLGFGVVDKIYLRFESNWWLPDWNGIRLLWTADDKENEEHKWLIDVFGFFTVDQCPDVLCGWVTGPSAKIMESLSDEEVLRLCSDLLRRFVAKHRKKSKILYSDPVEILRSKWGENPYSKGSYSLRLLKTEKYGSSFELSKPVIDSLGRSAILFGGEATSKNYYSTVHGAVESGFREATRIISLNPNSLRSDCITSSKNVLVIGAGISGLAAAHTLLKTNLSKLFINSSIKSDGICSVKILEAKSRPGGRINTVNFGNDFVEAGAQWLHGSKNALFKVSDHYKLLSDKTSMEGQGLYINEYGATINDSVVNKIDFIVGQILENLEAFAENESCDYPDSVENYLKEEFDKYLATCSSDTAEMNLIKKYLYEWHVRFQIIDNSCLSLKDLSAKAWGKYSFEGENSQAHINYLHGYSTVIEKLCNTLPKKTLEFNKEVVSVQWSENGVKVCTMDNIEYNADYVIVTVSLGVLKKNYKNWFKPSLPKNVTQAIEDMGFATINKIFLQFEEAWWNDNEGFQFVWFDAESKCKPDEASSWVYDMSGFDVLYPGATNTLVGWVGARGAILVEERSADEIAKDCVTLLRKILKIPVPTPCRVYRSKWHTDPHTLGSYSHTRPICDKNNTGWKDLASPILDKNGQPRILFAGEACSEQFFSTTHGAMKTGIEQAEIILESIRNIQYKNFILEASDRIGGRIYTTNFNNNTVDLGAQWCHGEEGNIVYDIVKDLNLLSGSEMYWNNEFLISDGTIVPKNNSKKLEEIYYEIGINDDDIFDSDTSVGQFKIKK